MTGRELPGKVYQLKVVAYAAIRQSVYTDVANDLEKINKQITLMLKDLDEKYPQEIINYRINLEALN